MAFRTNKTPTIEERTVSGSSVSFNSAFALPLKACISNFEGYQEGSGIPSPSNIRLLHAYSQATLTENNTPHVLTFGRSVYLGSINWLTGEVMASWLLYNLGNLTWTYDRQYSRFVSNVIDNLQHSAARGLTFYSECYQCIDDRRTLANVPNYSIYNGSEGALYIRDSTFGNDVNSLIAFITDKYVALPLAEPITIQLSANELSSIIGNNTFSTDTGTLEITYKDLDIAKRGNFREVFKLPS